MDTHNCQMNESETEMVGRIKVSVKVMCVWKPGEREEDGRR